MEENQIPKLDKVNEIGGTAFQIIEMKEKILSGWDKLARKSVYLFKMDSGAWGYYNKEAGRVTEVDQWKDKSAWINGQWIRLSIYYRIHVVFANPIEFTVYDYANHRSQRICWQEALIKVTDKTYALMVSASQGRDPRSFYRFGFKAKGKKGGGEMLLVDTVTWVG